MERAAAGLNELVDRLVEEALCNAGDPAVMAGCWGLAPSVASCFEGGGFRAHRPRTLSGNFRMPAADAAGETRHYLFSDFIANRHAVVLMHGASRAETARINCKEIRPAQCFTPPSGGAGMKRAGRRMNLFYLP